MKTRLGFVSNSSSSNFIMLGFNYPYDSDSWEKIELLNCEYLLEEGIAGVMLARWDDEDWDIRTYSDVQLADARMKAEDLASKLGVPLGEVKLYIGKYAC